MCLFRAAFWSQTGLRRVKVTTGVNTAQNPKVWVPKSRKRLWRPGSEIVSPHFSVAVGFGAQMGLRRLRLTTGVIKAQIPTVSVPTSRKRVWRPGSVIVSPRFVFRLRILGANGVEEV